MLDEGIVDMPMIWQTDAFALATGYDEAAGRYIGLWTPDDKGARPPRPTRFCSCAPMSRVKQREAERSSENCRPSTMNPARSTKDAPDADHARRSRRRAKTRFYGVKTLNADKIALDFKNIAEK